MAILGKKAEAFHIELAQDVLNFIAQRVRTNVRRLEGALMRVASYQSLSGREISPETIEQLLRDILREEAKKTVTIDQIQKKVAEHFDVGLADMTSKRRTPNIVFPRQVAMYLARHHTKASLQQIWRDLRRPGSRNSVARLQNCLCAHEERGSSPPNDREARYTARQITPVQRDVFCESISLRFTKSEKRSTPYPRYSTTSFLFRIDWRARAIPMKPSKVRPAHS